MCDSTASQFDHCNFTYTVSFCLIRVRVNGYFNFDALAHTMYTRKLIRPDPGPARHAPAFSILISRGLACQILQGDYYNLWPSIA